MTRMTTVGRLSGAVALAVLAAACSDRTEDKAADGARDAGSATQEAARDTGNAVMEGGRAADAAVETMDVKMALTTDSRVDASDINVDSNHQTKTVTLKGRVKTEAEKTIAGDIATRRAVGYRVVNDLMVSAR